MTSLKTNSERLDYLFAIMRRAPARCCDRELGNRQSLSPDTVGARCERRGFA